MTTNLLRLAEVKAKTSLGTSTIYRLILKAEANA
jgi:predicted DNA-binding transcriptional regulator AlpA